MAMTEKSSLAVTGGGEALRIESIYAGNVPNPPDFSVNRQRHEGIFKDMSTGGTYIHTRGRFQIGQPIIVAGILARDG